MKELLQAFVVILVVVLVLSTTETDARGQIGKKLWEKSYGESSVGHDDYGYGVAIDTSGNVISVGKIYSLAAGFTGSSGYAVKYDEDGNLVTPDWPIIVDPPLAPDKTSFQGVTIDTAGNLLLAGDSEVDNRFTTWKFPAAGGNVAVWEETLEPTKDGSAYGICSGENGSSYVIGVIDDPEDTGTSLDWAIVKYDVNGVEQSGFPIYYDHGSGTANQLDAARGIATDSQGNIIVVGPVGIDGAADNSYNHDWHVRTYTADGDDKAHTTFTLSPLADVAHDVAVDSQDNIYIVGYQNSGTGNVTDTDFDWVIKKLSSDDLSEIWSKSYTTGRNEIAYCIAVDDKNNIYVGGYATDDSGVGHWRLEYRTGATGTLLKEKTWESLQGSAIRAISLRDNKLALSGDYSNGSDRDWYTALYDVYTFPWVMFQAAMSGNGK